MKPNKLNARAIKALKEHLLSGYETDKNRVERVINAIELGKITFKRVPDEFYRYEELAGDCFKPDLFTDVSPLELKKQETAFKARIRKSGVWIYSTEFWNGRAWSDEGLIDNTLAGNVSFDIFGSGYEMQLLEEALEAYNAQALDSDGFVIDPYRLSA